MISRHQFIHRIHDSFRVHPVTALMGPRQCGKTTLARIIAETEPSIYFDLEKPVDLQRLSTPMLTLEKLSGLIIIDEIQRRPQLFELLRVLVDRSSNKAKFLILGSASSSLIKDSSESLAGRVGLVDLSGFNLLEVGTDRMDDLWLRGGFPRAFLAPDISASEIWRHDFIHTFLERDIPQLGITIPAETLRRFWNMIAHYHGQVWNAAEFGRSLGTSEHTARHYLDILAGAYMVRILPHWFENLKKRQVKSPKIYIRDSGILHALLHIQDREDLEGHPKVGASWEGFAIEQLLGLLKIRDPYYWRTHAGAELDLLITSHGKYFGFEFKYSDAPTRSRSMLTALKDLNLSRLWVIYPGTQDYELHEKISVLSIRHISKLLNHLLI